MNTHFQSPATRLTEDVDNVSAAAARLVEAARFARDGDCQTAQAYIARALALIHGRPSSIPVVLPVTHHRLPAEGSPHGKLDG